MVFGKNTMIRRCLRNLNKDEEHPEYDQIVNVMKGNLGFVFTNEDLADIIGVLKEIVKPADAKAGVIAPSDCTIYKGPTGLDPAQTSFFQALNIPTKINKGSIEIINDCQVIFKDQKVGTSEAALLTKLGVKPFEYGLLVKYIYENGIFDPSVMKITEEVLMQKWAQALGNVASLSLYTGLLTEASLAPTIVSGFKDVVAVALELEYLEFDQVKMVKEILDNPDAFKAAAVAAPAAGGGGGGGGAAAAPAPEPEPEEEEEDMGFDLF